MTSSGIYIPTAPFTDLLDRSSFVELYIMPISYPRNRALPVWACVISVFSADKVSFSSVWRNEAILSLIWWASSKGPANPKRKSSAYRIYRNLLLKGCTKSALDPLRAASNLAVEASGARESLPQLIFVALHAANLGQLLKDVPLFFVRKTLLERSLFVTDALVARGEARRGHMQPEAGTTPPGDIRHYGIKSLRTYLLKTEQ